MKKVMATLMALVMMLSLMACGTTASAPQGGDDGGNVETAVSAVKDGATLGEGAHSFTLEIVDGEGNTITATVQSDEETVGEALKALDIVQGDESEFGMYIKTVNGITADYDVDQTYWAFYVDGDYAQVSADMTAITDGSVYRLAVEKG